MSPSEQTPLAAKGSWLPFMCPSCRGLFRARSSHSGRMECPLCDSPFLLPKVAPPAEEEIKPLERHRMARPETLDWDKKEDQETSRKRGAAFSRTLIISAIFLFSALVVAGGLLLLKSESQGENALRDLSPNIELEEQTLLEIQPDDIEAARTAANKFLNLKDTADFPNLIREPKRVMPLVEKYYEDTPYKAPGIRIMNESGRAQVAKRFVSFNITLKDYSTAPIAVEMTSEGPRVDWESWVSYCEKPWAEFIEKQIDEPTLVRVNIKRLNYYNFDFRDDSQWVCFQLSRSSDDEVLYGYIPRDSPALRDLPKIGKPLATFVVKIRFPTKPQSNNQVYITDIIQSGWVLGL